ncbi:uncharacterized protein [Procambarus clarkii]|uniref:uncharacterized protein n=1 Tax=Procambarus clarkii TaxID=6728 RepID=UPI0037434B2D
MLVFTPEYMPDDSEFIRTLTTEPSVTEQSAPSDPTASQTPVTQSPSPQRISSEEGAGQKALPQGHQRPRAHHRTTAGIPNCAHPSTRKVTTRPRPTPSSPPSLAAEATTPHRGEAPGGEETSGTPETQASTSADTWTSATTNFGVNDASGTTPSTPEDPQSLNSPTSAQADDERRERLGTGLRSSEPEADSETRAPLAGRTDARRRTAAASTTGGTGPHTSGAPTATPAQPGPEARMQGQAQQLKSGVHTAMPHREQQEGPRAQQRQEQE